MPPFALISSTASWVAWIFGIVASAKFPEASSSKPIFTGSAALDASEVSASPAVRARRIQPDGFSNMRVLQKRGLRQGKNADKKSPLPNQRFVKGLLCRVLGRTSLSGLEGW